MSLTDTYLGFTENLKPMHKARKEKTMDNLVRYENRIITEKEFILTLLKKGSFPTVERNFSYYSHRLNSMTKPKTDYRLTDGENYYSISKTSHDFALHIIENDFLNEKKLDLFIINEMQVRKVKQRLTKEKLEKEKLKKEKEEEEKKLILEKERGYKIAEWEKKGNEILTESVKGTIDNIIEKNFTKYGVEANDEERRQFINKFKTSFTQKLGNRDLIIHLLKYHLEEGYKKDYFHPITIEAEIFMHIFNVKLYDSYRMVTSKVKALFK
ncbi:hypothetical protein P4284_23770 [Bacillus swezeyi]|uniref:hypothetical protein n=1 Tax=Bacillus swezeyi TaxID=1925020 RepID=UPI002E1FFB88|nr:hypothetical protein [Bacillus swezeyi]MED2979671.1 hypothetical protein [Bacillus swezeyi]